MRRTSVVFMVAVLQFAANSVTAQTRPNGIEKSWNVHEALVRLSSLGFWPDTSATPLSSKNRQAIVAFEKVQRLKRTGKLSDSVAMAIRRAERPLARDSMHRLHMEVDLNRQVLFVVDSVDHVWRILPVSTGNGQKFFYPEKGWEYARTPRGTFRIYYKVSGWKKSELGMLYDPMYIRGGFAIHGAQSVPAVPASHGCIRVPMFAAATLFRMMSVGTPVVVFGENPKSKD
ncbi:MAG: L,D-transpeptidase [Bacteroidetes bacterium]|nr:L,D-transpeptidase [Bacteroidota bacterium]